MGNNNFQNSDGITELEVTGVFVGTIGDFNWENALALKKVTFDFDGNTARIGDNNFEGCNLVTGVYIDCPIEFWNAGNNNFLNCSAVGLEFFITATHFNDYDTTAWKTAQSVDNNATFSTWIQ